MKTILDCNLDIIYTDYEETDGTELLVDIRKKFINNGSWYKFLNRSDNHPGYPLAKIIINSSDEEVVIENTDSISFGFSNTFVLSITDLDIIAAQNTRSCIIFSMDYMSSFCNISINSYPTITTTCLLCTSCDLIDGYRICKKCDQDYGTYIKNRCTKVIFLASYIDLVEDINNKLKQTFVAMIKKWVSYRYKMEEVLK